MRSRIRRQVTGRLNTPALDHAPIVEAQLLCLNACAMVLDDLTHLILGSLATLIRTYSSDPRRHRAGLVARHVAEHVVVRQPRSDAGRKFS